MEKSVIIRGKEVFFENTSLSSDEMYNLARLIENIDFHDTLALLDLLEKFYKSQDVENASYELGKRDAFDGFRRFLISIFEEV